MDFRYAVHDPWHGEFHLDHCGALMDVEPMGERYVRSMCHDIEDPTFDATAVATNPRAQVRPVHRPPRTPADRHPHCAWTVTIDDAFPVAPSERVSRTDVDSGRDARADPIDPDGRRCRDYAGPLLSDVDFGAFSRSALVRVADEVVVQMQLLALGFGRAVTARAGPEQARRILTKALTGVAGITAERLHRALGCRRRRRRAAPARAAPVAEPGGLRRGPVSRPASSRCRASPAHEDGGWLTLCGPGRRRRARRCGPSSAPSTRGSTSGSRARARRGRCGS
jgi:hypothetical protein